MLRITNTNYFHEEITNIVNKEYIIYRTKEKWLRSRFENSQVK